MGNEGGGNRGDRVRTWWGLERDEEFDVAPAERQRRQLVTVGPGPLNVMWNVVAAVAALLLVIAVGTKVRQFLDDGFDWSGLASDVVQALALLLVAGFAVSNTTWGRPWFDRPLRGRRSHPS